MKSYQVINKLNELNVSYGLQNITDTHIEFVVKNFVWASVVKLDLINMKSIEIHGLGSSVTERILTEENMFDYLEMAVKHFSRIGAISYEPLT